MPFANEDNKYKDWVRECLTYCSDRLNRHKFLWAGAVLLVCVVFFLAGNWYGKGRGPGKAGPGGRKILHYVDPMNPAHTSPEPGIAPCGMKLEPVYADAEGNGPDPTLPPGAVKVTPQKQQLIGVRLAPVEKSPYTLILRALGKVAVDETRVYRLNAAIDGWIRETFNNSTGMVVKKDEPLASFYSPEFLSAQQSLIYSMGAQDQYNAMAAQEPPTQRYFTRRNLKQAEDTLRNLGMTEVQIKEVEQSRMFVENIAIRAPATSFIIARNISMGQRFEKGFEWYRLADLSLVWVQADLYESEAQHIRPGDKVKVTYPYQKKTFQATVSEVPPIFDPASRTLKMRLEVDNPSYLLRPEMFVDVEFPIKLVSTVNVPVDAVLDTGLKKTVFVAREDGYFEPRQVETGWRLGDRVEILKGLEPGEKIVVSGNFLIDSESRMKLAAVGMYGETSPDPICGMHVEQGKSEAKGLKAEFQGHPYYFCSEQCKRQFEAEPTRYLAKSDQDHGCDQASAASGGTQPATESAKGTEASDQPATGEPEGLATKSGPALNVEVGAGNPPNSALSGYASPRIAPPASPPGEKVPDMPLIADQLQDMPKSSGAAPGMPMPGMSPAPAGDGQPMAMHPGSRNPGMAVDKNIPRDIRGRPMWNQTLPRGGSVATPPDPAGTAAKPPVQAVPMSGHEANVTPIGSQDPVCGMGLDEAQVKSMRWKSELHGKTYYFCSEKCKQSFDKAPERYLAAKKEGAEVVKQRISLPPTQPGAGSHQHD